MKPQNTYFSGAQSSIPHRSFRLLFSKFAFEILDLLPVALKQSICINDFFLLCI